MVAGWLAVSVALHFNWLHRWCARKEGLDGLDGRELFGSGRIAGSDHITAYAGVRSFWMEFVKFPRDQNGEAVAFSSCWEGQSMYYSARQALRFGPSFVTV